LKGSECKNLGSFYAYCEERPGIKAGGFTFGIKPSTKGHMTDEELTAALSELD
jgi:hypothetical protein